MQKTSLTTFYIARHGKTELNEKGILMGRLDSPLTEEGKLQAQSLAIELKDIKFDLAFSSDLLRALRTAEIVALERKLAVQTTELLQERSFGKHEGSPYESMRTYEELFRKLSGSDQLQFEKDDVESIEKMLSRVLTFLRETAITHPGKTVLVLTHGGVMHSLLIHFGYGTYNNFSPFNIHNGAYIKVESDGVDFFLKETKNIIPPEKD